MKFSTFSAVAGFPLLAPGSLAWRIRLYKDLNFQGEQVTYSGPGNPGEACFSVDPLNQAISSMQYYAYNSERTTQCCIWLYDSPGCMTKSGDWNPVRYCLDTEIVDFKGSVYQDDISSFGTECYEA